VNGSGLRSGETKPSPDPISLFALQAALETRVLGGDGSTVEFTKGISEI